VSPRNSLCRCGRSVRDQDEAAVSVSAKLMHCGSPNVRGLADIHVQLPVEAYKRK